MNIEHCDCLSWFSRKGESQEQDGERLSSPQQSCGAFVQHPAILPWPSDLPAKERATARSRNRQFCCRAMAGAACAAARAASAARKSSTTNAKSLDQPLVTRIVGAPEIIQNLASLRHELQQPAPRVIVFDMGLEVLRQIVDPLRQKGDLHLGRTGILGFDG